MKAKRTLVRARVLVYTGCAAVLLIGSGLWMLKWIARESLHCTQWRFTAYDGKSVDGDVWHASGGYSGSAAWERRISGLSGQLVLSVPVDADLPWYKKPFQTFRPAKRVPYRNGVIDGTVVEIGKAGHESSIQQYREGKEHGIYCSFHEDGSFSHMVSFKDGMHHGPRISCWTNGLLSGTDVASKGEMTGMSRDWWPSGGLKREGVLSASKRVGKHSFWLHQNGAKSHETLYSADGIPMQTTVWAADGNCIGTGTYKDGKPWDGWFPLEGKMGIRLGRYSGGESMRDSQDWIKDSYEQ